MDGQPPGDLVQLDTLDVRFPGTILKQFTAPCWDVVELARRATARSAAAAPGARDERTPFGIRAISIDNGAEFIAEFEAACAERGIGLFVLPSRRPKLHGAVERANRTHTEEFHKVTDAPSEMATLRAELRAWETTYNTIRLHQALGYLTPAENLASPDSRCVTDVPDEYSGFQVDINLDIV